MRKKIFLIAGEHSGDLQGALLLKNLKALHPDLECKGLGGHLMAQEGMEVIYDLPREAVLGLGDVLKKYFLFRRIFNQALAEVRRFKPDAIILIDYPGFNLRFAKAIQRAFPVIYYVSPQIWAWGGWRIDGIRKTIHHVMCFFQFEEELYRKAGVPATWVGHPLVDKVKPTKPRNDIRKECFPGKSDFQVVGLLPGSRGTEVSRILPEMLKAAKQIWGKVARVEFLLAESPSLDSHIYDRVLAENPLPFEVKRLRSRSYDVMAASDFAFVSSGTATLETALSHIPFVVLYKTASSTFYLGRRLIQIPYIGLVNVVAGRKVVPEFIQQELKAKAIAEEAIHYLESPVLRQRMLADLKEVEEKLGPPNAARRAAETVLKILKV